MSGIIFTLRLDVSPALLAVIGALARRLGVVLPGVAAEPAGAVSDTSMDLAGEVLVGGHGGWITPERDAVLRELFPVGAPMREIRKRVNALPGAIPAPNRVRSRAYALGLSRPEGFTPPAVLEKLARMRAVKGGKSSSVPPPIGEEKTPTVAPLPPGAPAAVEAGGGERPAPPAVYSPSETSLAARARIVPAAAKPPPVPRPEMARKPATRQQIIDFCRGRGWTIDKFEIEGINKRLGTLGHPGFDLIDTPPHRGRAA